jgi:hypothetical protein
MMFSTSLEAANFKRYFRDMGMPLRITFKDTDYNFQVINKEPITKSTLEIPIILDGQAIYLVKENGRWHLKEPKEGANPDLIQAVGRAIELRFRL